MHCSGSLLQALSLGNCVLRCELRGAARRSPMSLRRPKRLISAVSSSVNAFVENLVFCLMTLFASRTVQKTGNPLRMLSVAS